MEHLQWYALYTKPRWEKKVSRLLGEKGFEAYCPLTKARRKWSDRIKLVEEPLFKSYVFVRVSLTGLQVLRSFYGVLNVVYWNGKPAVIQDKELIAIKRFLNDYEDVIAVPFEVRENTRVMITQGAMMDREGVVLRVLNNKIEVEIESLGYTLVASVDRSIIKPID